MQAMHFIQVKDGSPALVLSLPMGDSWDACVRRALFYFCANFANPVAPYVSELLGAPDFAIECPLITYDQPISSWHIPTANAVAIAPQFVCYQSACMT